MLQALGCVTQVRLSNQLHFNRAVRRLPPGPERTVGQAMVHLLQFHQPLEERGRLWTGLRTPAQGHLIQGALAGCTLRAGRRILVDISTRAAICVTHLWSLYQEPLQHCGGGPPTATLPKHTFVIPASGPPRQLHVRRRRFRARPSRHHSGPNAPGTTPLLPTPTTPLGTGTPPVPDGTGRDAHYYIVNILLTIFQ